MDGLRTLIHEAGLEACEKLVCRPEVLVLLRTADRRKAQDVLKDAGVTKVGHRQKLAGMLQTWLASNPATTSAAPEIAPEADGIAMEVPSSLQRSREMAEAARAAEQTFAAPGSDAASKWNLLEAEVAAAAAAARADGDHNAAAEAAVRAADRYLAMARRTREELGAPAASVLMQDHVQELSCFCMRSVSASIAAFIV